MLTPVEFPAFRGLDLRRDPQEARDGAVDLQNVVFDEPGVVRTRPGTALILTAAANPTAILKLSSNKFILTTGSNLYAVSGPPYSASAGTACTDLPVQTVASPEIGVVDTAFFTTGVPTSTIKMVDASAAITSPAGIPTGSCLAVQSPDARLVVGNAGNNSGRVAFSDPGAPGVFGANNYVTLPGLVIALVTWNDLLFAFCSTGLYVFYGNSTDSAGEPIFNFRLVARVEGLWEVATSALTAVAGPDGVYFVSRSGVHQTTGGPPISISDPLQPMFTQNYLPPYLSGQLASWGGASPGPIHADSQRLYLYMTNGYWFVYSFATKDWSWWGQLGQMLIPAMPTSSASLQPILGKTFTTAVTQMSPTATSDNSAAIASWYRSGFWNPGPPGTEANIREWLLDGVGAVTFKTAVNDVATLGSGATVTLGTSPAIAQGRDRRAVRGRDVSFEISATSGVWSVSRVIAEVAGTKGTGEKST